MSSLIKTGKGKAHPTIKQLKFAQKDIPGMSSANQILKQEKEIESPELSALKLENTNLREAIKQLKIDSEQAISATKIKAEKHAKESIKQDFSKAYDKLGVAISKALEKVNDQLASSEALALLIAQTALEKIFHPDNDYRELTSRMVAKQMQALRREIIVKVRVSGQDFEDDEALEDLAFALDLKQANIKISQNLRAGDCLIDLRLGHMELSVKKQWEELQKLFKDMAMDVGLS